MNSPSITVHCGLKNFDPKQNNGIEDFFSTSDQSNQSLFWPVLEAVRSSFAIDRKIFSQPYQLVFSSKTAIKFFCEEFSRDIFTQCTGIYFVGRASLQYFRTLCSDLENLLFDADNAGMADLIHTFALQNSQKPVIFVTAAVGRSVLAINKVDFRFKPYICPIYDVVAHKSNFLTLLFQSFVLDNRRNVVFECHSAQILTQASIFLMQYFQCDDIILLPKNVFFSCFGQSTLDKVRELYGQRTG
jgi:uroporphyrinogen-III synthase